MCVQKLASLLALAMVVTATGAMARDVLASGQRAYQQGRWGDARQELEEYLYTHPTVYQAHYLLANTYLYLKQPKEARREYALVLSNKPDIRIQALSQRAIQTIDANKPEVHASATITTTTTTTAPAAVPAPIAPETKKVPVEEKTQ